MDDFLTRENERRAWHHVEYEIVRKMFAKGSNDEEMAEILGRSLSSVQKVRERLGLRVKRVNLYWSDDETDRLMDLYQRGCTDQEISDDIGRGASSIRRKREMLGLVRDANPSAPTRRLVSADRLLARGPLDTDEPNLLRRAEAHTAFLISLIRAGHEKGAGELEIPPDGHGARFYAKGDIASYCGSSAAMCVG